MTISKELEEILNSFVSQAIKSYSQFCGMQKIVRCFSPIRFHRYEKNQIMRKHFDHIHSIFDGKMKGIPVLSIIMNFNDDYEGGNLIFWDDCKVDLGAGDVVIFSSLFLFPHRVEEVTKNTRYSGVC